MEELGMAPCEVASFVIAREKSIAMRCLLDNETTQSAEVTEGETDGGASMGASASNDSGVESSEREHSILI